MDSPFPFCFIRPAGAELCRISPPGGQADVSEFSGLRVCLSGAMAKRRVGSDFTRWNVAQIPASSYDLAGILQHR